MEDPQPLPSTQTPLHIVPESILVKGEEGQYMDLGMTGDEEEEQQKTKPKSCSNYCLLCRSRSTDASISYHRHSILFSTFSVKRITMLPGYYDTVGERCKCHNKRS